MNRKRLRKLKESFAKRGGTLSMRPDASPEVTAAFLHELLECPDCRAAALEACNQEDRKNVDEVLRGLAMRGEH